YHLRSGPFKIQNASLGWGTKCVAVSAVNTAIFFLHLYLAVTLAALVHGFVCVPGHFLFLFVGAVRAGNNRNKADIFGAGHFVTNPKLMRKLHNRFKTLINGLF